MPQGKILDTCGAAHPLSPLCFKLDSGLRSPVTLVFLGTSCPFLPLPPFARFAQTLHFDFYLHKGTRLVLVSGSARAQEQSLQVLPAQGAEETLLWSKYGFLPTLNTEICHYGSTGAFGTF